MALYDTPNSMNQAAFQQMCPALVSQTLFADCSADVHDHGEDSEGTTDAESKSCCVVDFLSLKETNVLDIRLLFL